MQASELERRLKRAGIRRLGKIDLSKFTRRDCCNFVSDTLYEDPFIRPKLCGLIKKILRKSKLPESKSQVTFRIVENQLEHDFTISDWHTDGSGDRMIIVADHTPTEILLSKTENIIFVPEPNELIDMSVTQLHRSPKFSKKRKFLRISYYLP